MMVASIAVGTLEAWLRGCDVPRQTPVEFHVTAFGYELRVSDDCAPLELIEDPERKARRRRRDDSLRRDV